MHAGAITEHIDVAQVVLYAFWIFFALLIVYLRREDRREGYPLVSDPDGRQEPPGFVTMPKAKIFRLFHGGTTTSPQKTRAERAIKAEPTSRAPGAPLEPTGNPMLDGVGPASWVERAATPDLTAHGQARIVPLRVATDFWVAHDDPDPRGMKVIGADGRVGGVVRDIWVDRSEAMIRYLEVEVPLLEGARHVLLPMPFAQVQKGKVKVVSILASQFAAVPGLADPDIITRREEDQIVAYYGGGILYATPSRQEPLI